MKLLKIKCAIQIISNIVDVLPISQFVLLLLPLPHHHGNPLIESPGLPQAFQMFPPLQAKSHLGRRLQISLFFLILVMAIKLEHLSTELGSELSKLQRHFVLFVAGDALSPLYIGHVDRGLG